MEITHNLPHGCEVVKPLQAGPKAFCAGFPIAFPSEKASEICNHPGSLAECRWMRRWNGVLRKVCSQRLPLGLFEENRTGDIGSFTTEFGQMIDAPTSPPTFPEPATILLLGFGMVGLAGARRRFNK